MARNETDAPHNAESLEHLAVELTEFADDLRAAAALLKHPSPIAEVRVRFDRSREDGFNFVRTWVNAAKKAASDARLQALQRNGVPHSKPRDSKPPKS